MLVSVLVGVSVGVLVGVLVGVSVGVSDGVGVDVSVGVSDGVDVIVSVGVLVSVSVAIGVLVGVSVGVSVAGGVFVSVGLVVAVRVLVGVSVDEAQTERVVPELRGDEGLRDWKSFELLSVSWHPSLFRPRLLLAEGAEITAVSTKAFVAVPYPTESTIVPVSSPPLRIAIPPPVAEKEPVELLVHVFSADTPPS